MVEKNLKESYIKKKEKMAIWMEKKTGSGSTHHETKAKKGGGGRKGGMNAQKKNYLVNTTKNGTQNSQEKGGQGNESSRK